MKILVDIAPGELIDKLTILEIKLEKIKEERKLANIRSEYADLMRVFRSSIVETGRLTTLIAELKRINATLWRIEDDIRDQERAGTFGQAFVDLARSVYRTNDLRAATKREINELLNSAIIEEKSYSSY
ncbi:MAG: hypothetical protein QOK01_2805 [Alphaproteobacteria bacterium]|jgi:Family of unknown function (DUF6165)|nr:hypothetical protein [Alphaproteobacteria bacterium]